MNDLKAKLLLSQLSKEVPYFRTLQAKQFTDIPIISKRYLISSASSFINDSHAKHREYLARLIYDKQSVGAENISNFQVAPFKGVLIEQTTGTSGLPGRFPKTIAERAKMAVSIWAKRKKIDPGISANNFLAFVHRPFGKARDPRLYSSLCDDIASLYREASIIGARWLHVQPSLVRQHLRILKHGGISSMREVFKCVELSGETTSQAERCEISSFFGCNIVNQYGCVESWAIGYDTQGGCDFDVLDDNTHVELVKPGTGEQILSPGEIGDVVVTALKLRLFPIVRYRTGDRGMWVPTSNGLALSLAADREGHLMFVNGDFIPGSDVMRIWMNHAFARTGYLYYTYIQFRQTDESSIEIRVCNGEKAHLLFEKLLETSACLNSHSPINLSLKTVTEDSHKDFDSKRPLFVNVMKDASPSQNE